MRCLFLLIVCLQLKGQQSFISFDTLQRLPQKIYDSLGHRDVILLGEFHGTNESPMLAASFAELFIRNGKKVILALEIPSNEQVYIRGFMSRGDTTIFKRTTFFNKTRDGRTSRAMVDMLTRLQGNKNVTVCCMVNPKPGSARADDSLMADNIIRIREQEPGSAVVVLAGNIHTRVRKGFRKDGETMGYLIESAYPGKVLSINIRFQSGSMYALKDQGYKEYKLEDDKSHYKFYRDKEAFLLVDPGFETLGYHAIIYAREATPSPPYLKQ